MTSLTASTIPLAVRIKNSRYDGMLTGYLHDAPSFRFADPGGMIGGSIKVDQRLGFRSDMIQSYSRIYIYDKRTGDSVFEGDVSHPGRAIGDDGEVLEVQFDVDRLNDWSGSRIFIDRDMTAWRKHTTSIVSTSVEAGEDRAGSGADALTLAFPMNQHVEINHRVEAIYTRIRESGQELGWFNYAWDCGVTNASWRIRSFVSPPSTTVRDQASTTAGSGGSGAVVGGSIPVGAQWAFLAMWWTSGSSSTGTSGADTVWVSILRPIIIARLMLKDGVTFKTGGSYSDTITAVDVWNDLLGTVLANDFDGVNSRIDNGGLVALYQLAYPDGVTAGQVAEDLMKFEPACTYAVVPSLPGIDKYRLNWFARSTVVRYEAMVWTDDHSTGTQTVDQFDRAVARWTSPTGVIKTTFNSQTIPAMAAAGRSRTFWQDLSDQTGDADNAVQANTAVLEEHKYPKNGGQVTINRPIVDLFTGRTVQPYEIKPGHMIRLVGIDPSPDLLNASVPNGSTVCMIVGNDYKGSDNSASLDLDSVPASLFRAIAYTKRARLPARRPL